MRCRPTGRNVLLIATAMLATSVCAAQPTHRTPVIDLSFARHGIDGGFIDYRNGAMADLLAAGDLHRAGQSSIVLAGGASAVLGGFGDRCLIRPTGGCAAQGNFVAFDLLTGIDREIGPASGRALVGPAVYSGAGATSLGAQGRLDLVSPTFAHVGLGIMLRATVLPSHAGDRLVVWAAGGSLVIR
jgi:hypothetical protein